MGAACSCNSCGCKNEEKGKPTDSALCSKKASFAAPEEGKWGTHFKSVSKNDNQRDVNGEVVEMRISSDPSTLQVEGNYYPA